MSSKMSRSNENISGDLVKQEEITSPDLQMEESLSTEWTDEKHSLYLNSMEASFVKQLYNREYHSIDWISKRKNSLNPNSAQQSTAMSLISTGQFKVFRSGCWEKLNFERDRSRLNMADESHVLLESPWIQHFKSTGKCQEVISPTLEENGGYCIKAIHSTSSREFPSDNSHLHSQDSVCSSKEVSDQNFVDEDYEGENFNTRYRTKKMKKVVADVSAKDQVVPVGKSSITVDPNGTCASPIKDGFCANRQSENMDGFACLESEHHYLLDHELNKGGRNAE